MKNFLACLFFLLMISCGKKDVEKEVFVEENSKIAPYDTIAIDSFSNGAISVDIARKIKMSSVAYQDSLKEVRKKMEAEKLLQKEKEESDKATKKVEEDLKKSEALKAKKEKEKKTPEASIPDNVIKP
jgi:ASC-1-like (ASCH) protein